MSNAKLLSGHRLRHFPDRENEKGTPWRESLVRNEHGQASVSWMNIKKQRKEMFINCLKHSLKQEVYLPSFVFQVLAVSGRASPAKIWESGQLSQYNVEHWNTDNFQCHRCLY